jgi:hypothetical protein
LTATTAAATATIAAVQAESPALTPRDLSTDNDDDLRLGASCSTTPLLLLLSDADTPLFALFSLRAAVINAAMLNLYSKSLSSKM